MWYTSPSGVIRRNLAKLRSLPVPRCLDEFISIRLRETSRVSTVTRGSGSFSATSSTGLIFSFLSVWFDKNDVSVKRLSAHDHEPMHKTLPSRHLERRECPWESSKPNPDMTTKHGLERRSPRRLLSAVVVSFHHRNPRNRSRSQLRSKHKLGPFGNHGTWKPVPERDPLPHHHPHGLLLREPDRIVSKVANNSSSTAGRAEAPIFCAKGLEPGTLIVLSLFPT